jgi:hypothetical protein
VIFTAVHVVSILLDSFVQFTVVEVLIPFTAAMASARGRACGAVPPRWSSLAAQPAASRTWRRFHYPSFPLAITTVHLLAAGTDAVRRSWSSP